jgi:hypothetical protein
MFDRKALVEREELGSNILQEIQATKLVLPSAF